MSNQNEETPEVSNVTDANKKDNNSDADNNSTAIVYDGKPRRSDLSEVQLLVDRDTAAQKQIENLMSEEIKVRCHDRCPWGIRHILYFLSVITGLLLWLSFIGPFMLIQLFVSCAWYHCCCQCGGNKPKTAPKYDVSPSHCCCCGYVCLPFIGDCSLRQLETPPAKRGICWSIWGNYLAFLSLAQWIMVKKQGIRENIRHGLRLRNRYGDIFPHLKGLAVCDYNLAKEILHSEVHPRHHVFVNLPLNETFMRIGGDISLFQYVHCPTTKCFKQTYSSSDYNFLITQFHRKQRTS